MSKAKIRASSAYVYFSFVVGALLVGTLTTIEVPCPMDGGTGFITGAKGLEIKGVESELVDYEFFSLGCGLEWEKFTYAVNISAVNETATPSHGGIAITFYDPETAVEPIAGGESAGVLEELALEFLGPPIVRIPIFVEIPAETAETIEEIAVFMGLRLYGETHGISVKMVKEIVCPYSDGTGSVPITEWLWIKANVQ